MEQALFSADGVTVTLVSNGSIGSIEPASASISRDSEPIPAVLASAAAAPAMGDDDEGDDIDPALLAHLTSERVASGTERLQARYARDVDGIFFVLFLSTSKFYFFFFFF